MAAATAKSKKTQVKTREKSVILTEKQAKYVNGVLDGKTKVKAVADAGYAPNVLSSAIETPAIKEAVASKRAELSDALQITRADIIEGMQDAIALARAAGESSTMIAGYREIGKMLGLYEPETKKIELTSGQQAIRGKLEALSDAELLQLADGLTIEGESTRV